MEVYLYKHLPLLYLYEHVEVNPIFMLFYYLFLIPSTVLHGVTECDLKVDDVKVVSGRKAVLWESM